MKRIAILDALRGLSICLVLVAHFGNHIVEGLYTFQNTVWNIGVTGVFIFFCVSGYVIPLTLQKLDLRLGRLNCVAEFWTKRAFRILPVYLLLIAPAWLLLADDDRVHQMAEVLSTAPLEYILATITFTAYFVDWPLAFGGLEWSLAYEFVFYVICSLFLMLGAPRKRYALYIGVVFVVGILFLPVAGHQIQKHTFMLTFFLLGLVVYLQQYGHLGRSAFLVVSLIVVAGIYIRAITWAHMWGISYITVAAVLAPILFLAGCYLPNFRAVVPFLAPVGVISYSMYLTHMLVMAAFPLSEWSPVIRFCFWFIADIGLSLVVYRFIEAPANSLGHSLSSRWKPSL